MATFYKWGKRNDLVEDDPSYQIEKPKTPKTYAGLAGTGRTRHFQSLDTQLRRYPGDDIWPQSGLRISEPLSLQVHQIRVVDSVATSVRVIGKGNKERQVPLPESFGRVLALTIVGKTPDEYVFAKKPWQKPASAHAARAYQKKLIDKAGMKKMYIKQLVSMMAGHHFRGSIENTPDGEVAVVQMKDFAPEGGLNDANLYRVHVAGRKKPDYLQRDDILFIGRGNRIYAVLVDRDLDSTVAGSHFLFCG